MATAYEWEPPLEKVHTYTRSASNRGYRDPQLTADPTKLPYEYDNDYGSLGRTNPAYGAVNHNVLFPATQPVKDPEAATLEQYCMCKPKTDAERRLMLIVVVLAVLCLGLIATLTTVIPNWGCKGEDCSKEGGDNIMDLLPIMGNRLGAMMP